MVTSCEKYSSDLCVGHKLLHPILFSHLSSLQNLLNMSANHGCGARCERWRKNVGFNGFDYLPIFLT